MMMPMNNDDADVDAVGDYDADGDDKVGYWRWAMRWLDKRDENNNNIKGREVTQSSQEKIIIKLDLFRTINVIL